jgi:hypothetical protein
MRRILLAVSLVGLLCASALTIRASAVGPNVLLVGTFNGITGAYSTIQSAIDAGQPGDWVLVGPGDYHEQQDHANSSQPSGVAITKSAIHLRGMDRNGVIVDGTLPSSTTACSNAPGDQDLGPSNQGRNGIEVYGFNKSTSTPFLADGVTIDNLTVCNFLTGSGGGGNEVWWNGGDGTGRPNAPSIGLRGYEGTNLTATSTYSSSSTDGSMGPCCGTGFPAANYGIFSSNSTGPVNGPAHGAFSNWTDSYASNMADSDFYIGACWQRCDVIMNNDHGQFSSLCLSSTNAGGYFVMENSLCDLNKDGPVSNSQNNDDAPSPQIGLCDSADPTTEPQTGLLANQSCTVWRDNTFDSNNIADVPGNANNGLAGAGPVGTGLILAGTTYSTVYHNTITNNKAWGELIVDLPDPESGPSMCQGGTDVLVPSPPAPSPTEVCYYRAVGNVSLNNTFSNNGGYGNPTNGDIGLAGLPNNPGNCFSGDTDSSLTLGMPSTDPAGIETLPAYTPDSTTKMCTSPNAGDAGPLLVEAECASQLLAPCPTIQGAVCQLWPGPGPCPLPVVPAPLALYPHADPSFTLANPLTQRCTPSPTGLANCVSDPTHTATPTMANPCGGVPSDPTLAPPPNPWCPALAGVTPEVPYAALPVAAGGVALAAWLVAGRPRPRRKSSTPPHN